MDIVEAVLLVFLSVLPMLLLELYHVITFEEVFILMLSLFPADAFVDVMALLFHLLILVGPHFLQFTAQACQLVMGLTPALLVLLLQQLQVFGAVLNRPLAVGSLPLIFFSELNQPADPPLFFL